MNKIQMEDCARVLINIAEDILANIENVDFSEVKELIEKLDNQSKKLLQAVGGEK